MAHAVSLEGELVVHGFGLQCRPIAWRLAAAAMYTPKGPCTQ